MPTKKEIKELVEKCGTTLIDFTNTKDKFSAYDLLINKAQNDFEFVVKARSSKKRLWHTREDLREVFKELNEGSKIESIREARSILKLYVSFHLKLVRSPEAFFGKDDEVFDGRISSLGLRDFLAYCFVTFFKSSLSRNRVFCCDWCGKFFIATKSENFSIDYDNDLECLPDQELDRDLKYKFCPNTFQEGPPDKCRYDFHNALKRRKVKDCMELYYEKGGVSYK